MSETFFGMSDFNRGKYNWAEINQTGGGTKLYRRATTVAGYLDDLNGLIEWKAAMTACGVARSKSLQANLSLVDWYTDKMKTKEMVKKAFALGGGEEAADIGTAFHALVELSEAGTEPDPSIELPAGFADSLAAYKAYKEQMGITTVGSEVKVVDDVNEIAGTADLIYTFAEDVETPFGVIKAGHGIIGDVKTGTVADYSGLKMGMQLAIYSHGELYNADKGERLEWPVPMNKSIGLILKVDLKTGEVVPWWLNLEDSIKYVADAMRVWEIRKAGKKLIAKADVREGGAAERLDDPHIARLDDAHNSDQLIPESFSEKPEKLGAREVGKLITAATTAEELQAIQSEHGDTFTVKMSERWAEKLKEFGATPPPESDETEKPAEEYDYSVEIRTAMGQAETVDQLRAVWKTFAAHLSDKQKATITERVEKLKADEAKQDKLDQGMPPVGEGEPKIIEAQADDEPPFGQDEDEEPPFGQDEPEITPFSVEDAQARSEAAGNVGELKELWREFNRAVRSGKSTPEALKVITDRAAQF